MVQIERPVRPQVRPEQATTRDAPTTVGLVCPSRGDSWLGGLNYLHHLAHCMALPAAALRPRDVWWGERCPADDPFAPIRGALGAPVHLDLPRSPWARSVRLARRWWRGGPHGTLADVFRDAGVDVLFPGSPCERPGIPVVGWITDLQYVHLPDYYTAEQRRAFQDLYRHTLETSTLVMLSSAAAQRDLEAAFPSLAHKARVVRPCSVPTAEWWTASPAEVVRRLGLPASYLLVSNQVCAHKNHRTVFRALAALGPRASTMHVVCTGRRDDYRDPDFFSRLATEVDQLGLASRVHFVGALPRADHIALLRGAVALLQPSEFEGWGFALSDAQAAGTPAIASDIPVHHEHPPAGLRFVPPHDVEGWAEAMADAWHMPRARGLGAGPSAEPERVARDLALLFAEATGRGPRP